LDRARQSLQNTLAWYSSFGRHGRQVPSAELQGAVRPYLQSIQGAIERLERPVFRIAAFGLVSRGKSAVVNALLGQKRLVTSPLNGETRYPQAVQWTIAEHAVELIDTPGLDEIDGQMRALMAKDIAAQADLILFIVAGDLTQTEFNAIAQLRATHKPMLLVFNKVDLYPEVDRQMIYAQLQHLSQGEAFAAHDLLTPEEVVMVAAEPAPVLIRHAWPDGSVTETWETPPPDIGALHTKLSAILQQAGDTLLALNALVQARTATTAIARTTVDHQAEAAEALIWRYTQWKAIAVAGNPIVGLDLLGGAIADLALIRALAKLYGLPMTSFAAEKLWRQIVISSTSLLFGEIAGNLVLGMGKTASLMESSLPWGTWSMAAILQGSIAGYGCYRVGKVAQKYLEQGCTWGDRGVSPVIQDILNDINAPLVIARLRSELMNL
jgi:hypothetical protein